MNSDFVEKARQILCLSPSVDHVIISAAESLTDHFDLARMISDPESSPLQGLYAALQRKAAWQWNGKRADASSFQESDLQEAAEGMNTVREVFSMGTSAGKVELLCVASMLADFLDVDLHDCLEETIVTGDSRTAFGDAIVRLLSQFVVNVRIPPNAPYSDQKLYSTYLEGKRDSNIPKICEFIGGIERGRGFFCSAPLRATLRLLGFLDLARLAGVLLKAADPLTFMVFIGALPLHVTYKLALNFRSDDAFQLYALIRQIVRAGDEPAPEPVDTASIVRLLRRLYEVDLTLTGFLFSQFSGARVFYAAFGNLLATADDRIIDSFVETIGFEAHSTFRVDLYRVLYDQFASNTKNPPSLIRCEQGAYEKYLRFKRELVGNAEFLLSIFLGDFSYFVLGHLCRIMTTKEAFLAVFKKSFQELKCSLVVWHTREGASRTSYLLALTDLYLLSFCPDVNGYSVSRFEVSDLVDLLWDKRLWLWFSDSNDAEMTMPWPNRIILENLGAIARKDAPRPGLEA